MTRHSRKYAAAHSPRLLKTSTDDRSLHSNTNGSSYTYAERQMLTDGTKKERLGRDAMKVRGRLALKQVRGSSLSPQQNFNACSLCLERARDPRACSEGHIYCQVRPP